MKRKIRISVAAATLLLMVLELMPVVVNAAYDTPIQLQKYPLQGKIIAVDSGHGGSDTGAIGPNNVAEKTVTLAIAQELRKLLTAGGAAVVMTRVSDKDVAYPGAADEAELAARVGIANRAKADLFVSIHADAFYGTASGTTTYFYDQSENGDELAESVQDNLVTQLKLYDRGIEPSDYYVLKNTNMPAILTEAAFITNSKEEKLLTNRSFDRKVAIGIYNGIKQYFLE